MISVYIGCLSSDTSLTRLGSHLSKPVIEGLTSGYVAVLTHQRVRRRQHTCQTCDGGLVLAGLLDNCNNSTAISCTGQIVMIPPCKEQK